MSFAMHYDADIKAAQERFKAYRDEARREWLIQELKHNPEYRSNKVAGTWNRILGHLTEQWLKASDEILRGPSNSAPRTST